MIPLAPEELKLSKSQLAVLKELRNGVLETGPSTFPGRWVGGTTAASLRKRGLVKRLNGTFTKYQITDKGKQVLKELGK